MCASSQIRIGCSHGLHGPGRCICPTGKFERSDTIPPRCEDLPAFSVTFSARIGGEDEATLELQRQQSENAKLRKAS